MRSGTVGSRVLVQHCENFHPPPLDDDEVDDDFWASIARDRLLRFADDDPLASEIDRDCVDGGDQLPSELGHHDPFPPEVHGHGYRSSFRPRSDIEDTVDQRNDGVFANLAPSGIYVGLFGRYEEAPENHPGSFRSPSTIDRAGDGRLVIVDADNGRVQIFAGNGSYSSGFRVVGARAACFVEDAGGGQWLAVATSSGVSICDQTGRVDKHLPVSTEVLAVAALRHGAGVFVAAHKDRITICDRYKPTAVMRSMSTVRLLNTPFGHSGQQFRNIVALATTTTAQLYVVDGASVLAVDVQSGTLLHALSAPDTRRLSQPCAVAVDLAGGTVLVCDSTTRRVMQFDVDGGFQRCVAELEDDGCRCVALAVGSRGSDTHQLLYIVCCGPGLAQVRMYQA